MNFIVSSDLFLTALLTAAKLHPEKTVILTSSQYYLDVIYLDGVGKIITDIRIRNDGPLEPKSISVWPGFIINDWKDNPREMSLIGEVHSNNDKLLIECVGLSKRKTYEIEILATPVNTTKQDAEGTLIRVSTKKATEALKSVIFTIESLNKERAPHYDVVHIITDKDKIKFQCGKGTIVAAADVCAESYGSQRIAHVPSAVIKSLISFVKNPRKALEIRVEDNGCWFQPKENLSIFVHNKNVRGTPEQETIYSDHSDEQWPDFDRLLKQERYVDVIKANRAVLIDALDEIRKKVLEQRKYNTTRKDAKLLSRSFLIKISFDEHITVKESRVPKHPYDHVPLKQVIRHLPGANRVFGFDTANLIAVLKFIKSQDVAIYIQEKEGSAVMITGDSDIDYSPRYVMPSLVDVGGTYHS